MKTYAIVKRGDQFQVFAVEGDPVETFDDMEKAQAFVRESAAAPEPQPKPEPEAEEEEVAPEAEEEEAAPDEDEDGEDDEKVLNVPPRPPSAPALRDVLAQIGDLNAGAFKALGNRLFVAAPTNAFLDREGEIISEAALERYAARAMTGIVPKPELWHYHLRGTRHGAVEWLGVVDKALIAIGRFDDNPVGRAAEKYYQAAAPGTVTMSHGFMYRPSDYQNGVYKDVNIFEVSTLPAGTEANPFTTFAAVKEVNEMAMTEKQREQIQAVFGDYAPAIFQRITQISDASKALADLGVQYKEFKADATDAAVEAEQKAADSIDADALEAVKSLLIENNEAAGELATDFTKVLKGIGGLAERIKRLEVKLEMPPSDVQSSKVLTDGDGTDAMMEGAAAEIESKSKGLESPGEWDQMFRGLSA